MNITINNQPSEINATTSLKEIVIVQLGEKLNGVAVAVNETVIPKTNWEQYTLNENDKVLIIKATQGG